VLTILIMDNNQKYSQCSLCKFFVEDDESLKNPISYCILLGIHIDTSGQCPEFSSLNEEMSFSDCKSDPVSS
jgi:hypothetical protein